MSEQRNRTTQAAVYVVVVTAALVAAAAVAPVVLDTVSDSGSDEPSVAVITLRGGTTDANVAAAAEAMRDVRRNSSVDAVVLRIDSPGGPVDSSEEFYMAVNRTASEMPVVAYVEGTAASGGYYGIAPADEIIVKSSSTVGSIGVIVQAPLSAVENVETQREVFIRSGPDKAQISKDGIRNQLELLQKAFVDTIMIHRGEELDISREQVANGNTFLGPRAVENGFADNIGDLNFAIQRAANLSEDISEDQYNVYYKSSSPAEVNILVLNEDGETVGSDTATVNPQAENPEFVRPVRYYAVWGVPADTNATVGVNSDE